MIFTFFILSYLLYNYRVSKKSVFVAKILQFGINFFFGTGIFGIGRNFVGSSDYCHVLFFGKFGFEIFMKIGAVFVIEP